LADVLLPSLGESVTEGIVLRWMKSVGDRVERDEPLLEISTDKVDSEMPSPAAGVLTEILAAEGDTVEVGARLAVIDEAATGGARTGADHSPPTTAEEPPATIAAPAASAPTPPAPAPAPAAPGGVVASPVVRRILSDGNVDPRTVAGSGPCGSITRRDAEQAVANGPTDDVAVPLSRGRRRMAEHMAASALGTPHGFVAVEVDAGALGRLEAARRVTRDGAPIADETLVAVAAVRALAEFPELNATFAGEELVEHRTVNLGFARNAGDDGMLVPVVHAAAGLTLRALARRLEDLAGRVSTRQLTADDLMGGTFTIAASPSAHTLFSVPIIIQPEVAALSVGSVRAVALVSADNAVVAGTRLVLGLSYDHRVCDAVTAARYLERVGELLGAIDVEAER
jgi:2-oxoglutarate dehydrogenase E2 component (dihydrolipoamide succinyltransferase)